VLRWRKFTCRVVFGGGGVTKFVLKIKEIVVALPYERGLVLLKQNRLCGVRGFPFMV